jgi:hypothetical protein
VYSTRTKGLTTSRHKKAHTFAYIEEKFLISDEETEAERTRRRANKHTTTLRFNTELGRQAESEVPTLRELNAEESRIFQSKTRGAAQSEELE